MFEREEIEDIILGMADIVLENRALREELKEMREYKKKYHELLYDNLKEAEESNRMLLKCCLLGAFSGGINNEREND